MADIVELRPRRPVALPAAQSTSPCAAAAGRPVAQRRAPSPRLAFAAMAAVWMAPLAMALPLVLLARLSDAPAEPELPAATAAAPARDLAELLREATCASTVLCREPAQRFWAVGHPDPLLWHSAPAVADAGPAVAATVPPTRPAPRPVPSPTAPPPAAREPAAALPPDRLATLLPPDKAAAIVNRRPAWESATQPPADPARRGGLVTRLDSSTVRQVLARSPTRLVRPGLPPVPVQPVLLAPVQAGEVIVAPRQLPAVQLPATPLPSATQRTVRWSMDSPAPVARIVDLPQAGRAAVPRRSAAADTVAPLLKPAPRWTAEQRAARTWSRPVAGAPDAAGLWATRRAMRDSIPREGASAGAGDPRRLWAARRMRQVAPRTDG